MSSPEEKSLLNHWKFHIIGLLCAGIGLFIGNLNIATRWNFIAPPTRTDPAFRTSFENLTLKRRLEQMILRKILDQKRFVELRGIPKVVCREFGKAFMANRLCKITVSKCRFKV